MTQSAQISNDIVCPGCHFGCKLAKYQCGRGKEFYDIAAEGGEVPERRGPMMTPSERAATPDGKPPLNDRVMHALNITANRLRDRHAEAGERKVLITLVRTGSFMSVGLLGKRAMLSREELDLVLYGLQQAGMVKLEAEEHAGEVARITQSGLDQAATWKAERDDKTAEFLSALSDDEKEALVALVRKMLGLR